MYDWDKEFLAIGEKDSRYHILSNIICSFIVFLGSFGIIALSDIKTLYDFIMIFLWIFVVIYCTYLFLKRQKQYKSQQIYLMHNHFKIDNLKEVKIINFNNFACYQHKKFLNMTIGSVIYTKEGESIFLYATNINNIIKTFLEIYPQYKNTGINKKQNFKEIIIFILLCILLRGLRYTKNIPVDNIIKRINYFYQVK